MLVGDLEKALPHLQRGYEIRRATTGKIATSLHLLGRLHFFSGDLRQALGLYRDALPRLLETYGGGSFYIEALMDLAELLEHLGEDDEAEQRYLDALTTLDQLAQSLDRTSDDGVRQQKAAVQSRLGALLAGSADPGNRRQGEQLLLSALETQKSLSARPTQDYAQTLEGLAEIALRKGDFETALAELCLAADLRGSHPGRLDALLARSQVELELEQFESAKRTLDAAKELLPALGEIAYGARATYYSLKARWLAAEGYYEEALSDAARAARLYAEHLAPAFNVLPPSRALRYSQQNRASLDLALSLLADSELAPKAVRDVWQAVALNRGLVAFELEQRYEWARREADPKLVARLAESRRHLAETQIRVRRSTTVREREILMRHAAARVRHLERELAESTAATRPVSSFHSDFTAALPDILPPETTLVAFVRFDKLGDVEPSSSYGAFVFSSATRQLAFADLGSTGVIDHQIEIWRQLIREGAWSPDQTRLRAEGRVLRRLIWDPIVRLTGDSLRFLVVPEGSLFRIPFAALPGRSDATFLIEDHEVHHLVAERDLFERPDRQRRISSLLAIGGAAFNAGTAQASLPPELERPSIFERAAGLFRDPCHGGEVPYFSDLQASLLEATEIATIFGASGRQRTVDLLLERQATETAFKQLAPGYSVLHIATHGFADLTCHPNPVSIDHDRGSTPAEPLSGLAFAGANRRRSQDQLPVASTLADDGILTLPEISGLDLGNVDWAVLSACETALGPTERGEGVLGLARSFRIAGARTLIISLWPVEDEPTRQWMTELYRARFNDNVSTAAALRAASLAVLDQRRRTGGSTHPFNWAAFVASGDWN